MRSFPPIVPLLENAASDARFENGAVRMHDFAPLKLVNATSADDVARRGGARL